MVDDLKHQLPHGLQTEWYETGHINTTLIIARLAGIEKQLAQQIAIHCQLPDYYKMTYSAGTPLWAWIEGKGKDAEVISKILHGFHGGDQAEVERRQRFFRDLVREQMKRGEDAWKIGFAVHAFGDAYAHTYLDDSGARHAYGFPMGHGLDLLFCVKPDHISQHPHLYLDYCAALFWALCGEEAADSVEFTGFKGGFDAVLNHKFFVKGSGREQETIVTGFIIGISGDRTTHADMAEAMERLDYDEVIGFLEWMKEKLFD
ncbi:MAG: hypothetical protein ACE5DK_11530 [Paracoccaceae bacterium]